MQREPFAVLKTSAPRVEVAVLAKPRMTTQRDDPVTPRSWVERRVLYPVLTKCCLVPKLPLEIASFIHAFIHSTNKHSLSFHSELDRQEYSLVPAPEGATVEA